MKTTYHMHRYEIKEGKENLSFPPTPLGEAVPDKIHICTKSSLLAFGL
jgi:hypothetical protein